jgi:S-adenosylmethionine uptake transporter
MWFSLIIGFIGVLIIIRPGFRDLGLGYLLALLTPFVWAISNILTKQMVKTEKPESITFYLSFVMFILSIPFAAPYLKPISWVDFLWLSMLGLISNASYIANAICYSKVDISVVQPFDFSRLIFTVIISYFAFDEKVDLMMLIGAVVILGGSLLVIPRKSKFARFRDRIRKRKMRLLPVNQV